MGYLYLFIANDDNSYIKNGYFETVILTIRRFRFFIYSLNMRKLFFGMCDK